MDIEEFESLKPEEQAKIFYQSTFQEKGELFPYCHQPDLFAQSLSPEELYLMTRELDPDERSEVVCYANVDQLLFISDIDCWKKDRLSAKGFTDWLKLLLEADPERLLRWLEEMDYETVVCGFKKLVRVIKPEWEFPADELLGDEPYFSLDERYYILVKEENLETVRQVIERLYETHRGRYAALLEGILSEMDDEMEEEGYRKREMRLAERGFPDPETARHIYWPISRENFEKFPCKNGDSQTRKSPDAAGPVALTHYPRVWTQERLFLDDVLLLFQNERAEIVEGLQEEMMWLSNKILAAEGIDFASEDRVRRGVERARCLVNLGLEDLCGSDLEKARDILNSRWLETLFRWGVGHLMELRSEALKIAERYWEGDRKGFLEFLDSPYQGIFEGLLRGRRLRASIPVDVPACYDESIKGESTPLREFRDRADVERTRRAILQVDYMHAFLSRQLGQAAVRSGRRLSFSQRLNHSTEFSDTRRTLFSMASTHFASFVLVGSTHARSLTPDQLRRFLVQAFHREGAHKRLKPECKENFLNRFFGAEEQALLRPMWSAVFDRLEEELGGLGSRRKVDRRYVSMPVVSS